MNILDIKQALQNGRESRGLVYVDSKPLTLQGKRGDYMRGEFMGMKGRVPFKIWDERTFRCVADHGEGVYDACVTGSEYNGEQYLTVTEIHLYSRGREHAHLFLPEIPKERCEWVWERAFERLKALGLSEKARNLIMEILDDPQLEGRFAIEGAAVRRHDSRIRGLMHHTAKILNLLASVMENNGELRASIDLLTMGVTFHDIGKVFEYRDLAPSQYWYANHRVRGIAFLVRYETKLVEAYDLDFYCQLQSIVIGHHGEYGDRPTTIAAAIVHLLDNAESQITSMVENMLARPGERIKNMDWGYLQPLKLSPNVDVPSEGRQNSRQCSED